MKLLNEPSFSEIIRRAWELYRQNLKQLFVVALIFSVLYQLFIMFMRQSGLVDLVYQVIQSNAEGKMLTEEVSVQTTASMHLVVAIGIFFYLVILPFATALFQNIVDVSWQEKSQSITEHVKFVLSKTVIIVIATVMVYILLLIAVMVSSIVMGLLALVVYALFIVYIPLVLYDQKKALSSLQESLKLTILAFGRSLAIAVLCYFLLNVPSVVEWAVQKSMGLDSSLVFGIDEVITIFVTAFIWPLVAILKLALYYSLKAKQYNLKVKKGI
ncbi:hypothetical protein L3V86_02675 [Thiotrichales bacterium 19S11-10]|nr:hypothetical protein [Thiotrichales bacterium 19S11-10]